MNILLLTSSFFFFLFCFLCPHFYILDIFITFFCLWFPSIPSWSDSDLLTQTRTIAMSLVKCAGSDTQDQYKLVKDISFWKPLASKQARRKCTLCQEIRQTELTQEALPAARQYNATGRAALGFRKTRSSHLVPRAEGSSDHLEDQFPNAVLSFQLLFDGKYKNRSKISYPLASRVLTQLFPPAPP